MSTHTRVPTAHRSVEEAGAKHLPMQRSARRQALGALLGGLFLLGAGASHPVQAQEKVTFTTASLRGTYAYYNDVSNVGSLGLITFDGNGNLTAAIEVNTPNSSGGRTIVTAGGPGTYAVHSTGMGSATIEFSAPGSTTTYDFVITKVARDRALATEVFAVARTGGLAGQLIAATWSRISD